MNEYTPEKVAELVEKAETRVETGRNPDGSQVYIADDEARMKSLAEALTAVSAERDAATKRARQAWEVIDSDYWRNTYADSMARGNAYVAVLRNRIRATLRALRVVTIDRDHLHKAITEALDSLEENEDPDVVTIGVLRAALDKEGEGDE